MVIEAIIEAPKWAIAHPIAPGDNGFRKVCPCNNTPDSSAKLASSISPCRACQRANGVAVVVSGKNDVESVVPAGT